MFLQAEHTIDDMNKNMTALLRPQFATLRVYGCACTRVPNKHNNIQNPTFSIQRHKKHPKTSPALEVYHNILLLCKK